MSESSSLGYWEQRHAVLSLSGRARAQKVPTHSVCLSAGDSLRERRSIRFDVILEGKKTHMQGLIPIERSQEIGAAVEDVKLPNVRGGLQRLGEFLEGKKGVVVIFWSCICSHCVRYDRYLSSFNKIHPDLSLVAIASRKGETARQICDSAVRRNLGFPILHDPDGSVARRWFTQQTPRAFLVDSNRTLLYRGAIDNYKYSDDPNYMAYLESAIEQFVAGQPVTRKDTASFGCAIQSVYYTLPKQL